MRVFDHYFFFGGGELLLNAGYDSPFMRFLHHTQGCTTVRMTPLDEWSVQRGDLYLGLVTYLLKVWCDFDRASSL